MRPLLAWLTDAALADSILGDLEEGRRSRGTLWFWRALTGVTGYVAWKRLAALVSGSPLNNGSTTAHAWRAKVVPIWKSGVLSGVKLAPIKK